MEKRRTKAGASERRARRDLLDQAQELIYDAWETSDRERRVAHAQKAISISPDCADAYVLLAVETAALDEALELYRKGVKAGERALGENAFESYAGEFWGIWETRPYMRARAGLAQSLWDCGLFDEALAHLRDMLKLNHNDNQGIRYVLAARLLELGRDDELAEHLNVNEEDGSAFFMWTRVLLAFRRSGDDPWSRRALADALKTNPQVPGYLLGHKSLPLPQELPGYTGIGDESEAMYWAAENIKAWRTTNGAFAWLAERIDANGA
jgi:tetratricopeptide (TPR) repeat protein